MTQFVTRCPKCSTSFRITQAQLDRAKGAVRCGSCLQIFRANDHIVKQGATKPTPQVAAKPASAKPTAAAQPAAAAVKKPVAAKVAAKAAPAAAKKPDGLQFNQKAIDEEAEWDDNQLIHDDLYEEEDDRTGELSDSFFDVFEPRKTQHQPERTLFDREIKDHKDDDPDDADSADESWALNILEAVEDETREEEKRKPIKEQYSRATTGTFTALSDEDLESALGNTFKASGQHPIYDPDDAPAPSRKPLFTLEDEDDQHQPLFTEMEEVDDDPQLRHYDPARRAILRSIEPGPLELSFHVEASPWPKRALWGSLATLSLMAFIWQLGTYNIDEWGHYPSMRPYYEALCPLAGCEPPALSNPAKVMASNLVVRSHPRLRNALIIDAVLLNKASFDQPFPPLEIQFSDLQGTLVAVRRFRPKEYLGGELAGQTMMPSNQPVHIALEILDPGKDAVNYAARIVQ